MHYTNSKLFRILFNLCDAHVLNIFAANNAVNLETQLTNALSHITDADIAKASAQLTKQRVLLQSTQSMIAQVNQTSQGVLELLK
ncbi:hypothetical protein CSV75_07650 [Sporosarcina sp. P18a]|nr:hypothetical protein CSV75_07650 [Sporosarcina sp. P18a]